MLFFLSEDRNEQYAMTQENFVEKSGFFQVRATQNQDNVEAFDDHGHHVDVSASYGICCLSMCFMFLMAKDPNLFTTGYLNCILRRGKLLPTLIFDFLLILNFLSGIILDKNIRELTPGIGKHMDLENLGILGNQVYFGKSLRKFETRWRGFGCIADGNLEKFLFDSKDEKILILITIRWLAVVKKHGFYYIFNSHACKSDASSDKTGPAALFRVETAEEAAIILKRCAVTEYAPYSMFERHAVVIMK